MKKITAALIVAVISFAGCKSASENAMTMTTAIAEGEVVIGMAGTGTAVIDWGDGSAPETVILSASNDGIWEITDSHRYAHTFTFPDTTSCTIVINGQNITHLLCGYLQLTALDVRNNTVLQALYCLDNRLTNLDLSNNTALTYLLCDENRLTNLDVSQNTALTILSCSYNRLTSLDVSNSAALTELYCDNNQLTAEGVNALFGTLHSNDIPGCKTIYMYDNFDAVGYDWSIAENKGWKME